MPDNRPHDDSIPNRKYALSQVIRYIKGKARFTWPAFYGEREHFVGQHFRARGYFVSTVGRDKAVG